MKSICEIYISIYSAFFIVVYDFLSSGFIMQMFFQKMDMKYFVGNPLYINRETFKKW